MKPIILSAFLFITTFSFAQTPATEPPPVDKSVMDMSYFPANYPVNKIQNKTQEPLVARVIYSRPLKSGRIIFGDLVEYGKVWRIGANEATEIEFYKNVTIGGKKILKGRYTLYAIVNENSWTMIINKDTDTWGAFKYDQKKDVARAEAKVEKLTDVVEALSMYFEKTDNGCNLVVMWDNVKATMPISTK